MLILNSSRKKRLACAQLRRRPCRYTGMASCTDQAPELPSVSPHSSKGAGHASGWGLLNGHMGTAEDLTLRVPLVEQADLVRSQVSKRLGADRRAELGQYLTPSNVASFMASLFINFGKEVRLLDAGAGVGALLAATTAEACRRLDPPKHVHAVGFELDETLVVSLRSMLRACETEASHCGVNFMGEVVQGDFIEMAVEMIDTGLFGKRQPKFTHAILNPPYAKLNSNSATRIRLRRVGIETSNLYTAFVALAVHLLEPGGELVAITPRSFCNGPYFRPFRELLLGATCVRRFHMFESRKAAFSDDDVLQENVVFTLVKGRSQSSVFVSSSSSPDDDLISIRKVNFEEVVRPGDSERFIHLVPNDSEQTRADALLGLPCRVTDLGLTVSTGKVVDFRAREFLRKDPTAETMPLIYPTHFFEGGVRWPKANKKPNALVDAPDTAQFWMPRGTYVLVKRFSSKEEVRRVVAAVYDPEVVTAEKVGFENHLNVFHANGRGLDPELAVGLSGFLNSTIFDACFRQFNGHTQVNATDLRSMRYPQPTILRTLGRRIGPELPAQQVLDKIVEDVLGLPSMVKPTKIDEALEILKALGMPTLQQNERSALTLLALVGLTPKSAWSEASSPLMGITPLMEFFREHYGKEYKPNTRETVRRQTVHQFRDAGLILENPDHPSRPVNSPKAVYQIDATALELLRTYGTRSWSAKLTAYLKKKGTLAEKYAQARAMARLPVTLPGGQILKLTPGGQNELVKLIMEEFCPRFAPGAHTILVGDTGDKFAVFDKEALAALGVKVDSHGKMPDVIAHRKDKNWLLLIEAVTSHGPVNAKRRDELAELFKGSKAGLVYVTTFLTRKAMVKYLADISWETEVWVAESPDHMIHFDGEKFLGPYAG